MARIRTIRPEIVQSESLGRVSRDARLCFILLWTQVDDDGRFRSHSRMLASVLFPYDDEAPSLMDGWLDELEREGCIRRYVVDGSQYLDIPNWLKHQKIDKPYPSKLPPFDERSRMSDERSRPLLRNGVEGNRSGVEGTETRAKRASLGDTSFAEFWVAWPNKVEKPAALKAYRKALARASPSEILDGVRRYVAAKPPDRPWLNPSTFLNRDRWTDEPAQLTDGNSFTDKLAAIHRGAGLGGAAEHDDGRTIEGEFVASG